MESNNNRAQAQQRSSGRKQCAGCRTEVHDSRQAFKIEALDNRVYHIQCFRCCVCEREFDNDNPFIPQDGLAFCEQDYQQSLRNICGGCGQSVFSRVVYALGKPWHEEHLKCSACFKPIRGNPFEHNNKVYCAADYKNLVAEKCRECDLPIEGETICALDSSFHKECFVCKTCKEPFADRNFYVYDDEPLCNIHFHEKNNSLCGACGDPIEGPCADIAETGRRFHTNCWACCVCRTPLVSVYYSHNGRPYCEHDIHELYRREKSQNQRAKKRQTLMMNL
ncbi:uncharacterized protein EV422DRAFT_493447 [Fimicolochytrium jonesii]|uniref:uncharacterized protein n=1 Tax=Fimicolochytrium jonesii TaxID=1396493 RepID=UPI0022FDFE00|nr:uncharacterized protein EV422DRAFT_493447 [Fimicolochytrium jonesii]KAI8824104.1 hypothetical protein EV422DRAFT_493447 [Fimicolochytrium jonesii]